MISPLNIFVLYDVRVHKYLQVGRTLHSSQLSEPFRTTQDPSHRERSRQRSTQQKRTERWRRTGWDGSNPSIRRRDARSTRTSTRGRRSGTPRRVGRGGGLTGARRRRAAAATATPDVMATAVIAAAAGIIFALRRRRGEGYPPSPRGGRR